MIIFYKWLLIGTRSAAEFQPVGLLLEHVKMPQEMPGKKREWLYLNSRNFSSLSRP